MRVVLATIVAATGVGGLSPVRFPSRPGWHIGVGKVHACPGVPRTRCAQVWSFAATDPWRDCIGCQPHRLLAILPPDGIAIQVSLSVERPPVAKRVLAWPPRVDATDLGAGKRW